MVDKDRLFEALTGFARTMTGAYDVSDVLHRLTDDVVAVLGIAGAGIVVADEDHQLRYATASSEIVGRLEQVQESDQEGPCADAFRTQELVLVGDLTTRTDWVAYREAADRLGFRAVAGIPLSLLSERFGALNLYDREVRTWSDEELATARVLADMAVGYLVHARLEDSRRLAEQLAYALDARVVIEQAKGVLSAEYGVTVDEAFEILRRDSRDSNTSLRSLADDVVTGGRRPERDAAVGE